MPDLTFTPEQSAAMRETWLQAGYSAADFDAAVAPPPAASLGVQDPAGAAETAFQVAGDIPAVPMLEPAQLLEIAESLGAAGVPQDQIEAAMRADGLEPLGPDERSDDEKEYDRAFAPAAPHEYRFSIHRPDADPSTAAAANAEWGQWCHDVGFSAQIGAAVVELAVERGQWLARADEPTRALWRQEQQVRIEALAGGQDKVEAWKGRALAALVRGGDTLVQALTESGVIYDAEVLAHLHNQAERLAWRLGSSR